MEKQKKNGGIAIWIFAIIMLIIIVSNSRGSDNSSKKISAFKSKSSNNLNIISSSENKDLEQIIANYANTKGYKVNIEYAGSLDIMQKLNNGEQYDAVWLSNSIWMYMLDSSKVTTKDSKCTSINPVIFGITKSKAKELGFKILLS